MIAYDGIEERTAAGEWTIAHWYVAGGCFGWPATSWSSCRGTWDGLPVGLHYLLQCVRKSGLPTPAEDDQFGPGGGAWVGGELPEEFR
jgi:hypothetical protein